MSRPDSGEGFAVMDVSTAILDDEKFQQLANESPELYEPAVVGFMATLARSWKKGRRVTVYDAWPKYRTFNRVAVDGLIAVHLLDAKGCITARSWREWFSPARKRRDESRERWRRAQQTRRERLQAEAESPRGVSDDASRSARVSPTTSVRPYLPNRPNRTDPKGQQGLMDSVSASRGRACASSAAPLTPRGQRRERADLQSRGLRGGARGVGRAEADRRVG